MVLLLAVGTAGIAGIHGDWNTALLVLSQTLALFTQQSGPRR